MSSAPHNTPATPVKPPIPATAPQADSSATVLEPMRQLYDRYFASHNYQRRYPRPNQSTLAAIYRAGAEDARSILDVGCGHGRYILALLPNTQARIVACDISAVALQQLQDKLQAPPYAAWAARVQYHHGTAQQLPLQPRHDLLLLLFGVLSHAGYRADRLALLQALHQRASPAARLVLS
ncbi:MAG: class I SAM-dependent methyltransferase, partial [Rhodoferax sp.]|nr:class I SAM-dependent methyltransferase [Rhodoferax sp.]